MKFFYYKKISTPTYVYITKKIIEYLVNNNNNTPYCLKSLSRPLSFFINIIWRSWLFFLFWANKILIALYLNCCSAIFLFISKYS